MLARNARTNVTTFVNQIKMLSSPRSHRDRACTAVKYIRRLGNLPDGLTKAMKLLVEIADGYCTENGERNFTSDEAGYRSGKPEIDLMDKLMCDLIREHYTAVQISKVEWDTDQLLEEIAEVREERYPCEMDFGECDPRDRENAFENSIDLLELIESRRVATMLASKVTAHLFPPELVDMVRDYICSDEELRVAMP